MIILLLAANSRDSLEDHDVSGPQEEESVYITENYSQEQSLLTEKPPAYTLHPDYYGGERTAAHFIKCQIIFLIWFSS